MRDEKGRFVKGNTLGNGRRKMDKDVAAMLKEAVPEAVKMLIETMHDVAAKMDLRVKCAETIIERVYGKATQPIDGEFNQEIVIKLADDIREYAE